MLVYTSEVEEMSGVSDNIPAHTGELQYCRSTK